MTQYTWDQRHRLTRVAVTTAVNGTPITRTVDYSYDVFDRLIGRTESGTNAPSSTEGPWVLLPARSAVGFRFDQTGMGKPKKGVAKRAPGEVVDASDPGPSALVRSRGTVW